MCVLYFEDILRSHLNWYAGYAVCPDNSPKPSPASFRFILHPYMAYHISNISSIISVLYIIYMHIIYHISYISSIWYIIYHFSIVWRELKWSEALQKNVTFKQQRTGVLFYDLTFYKVYIRIVIIINE